MSKIKLLQNLAKVKSEIGKVSKDSTNPFFKSKYFDINSALEHVEPLLQKNGLVLLQPIESNKVRTEIHNVEDGQFVFSEMELPNLSDPQKLGSAITYFRRYTLQSLLGLQAEDDDGNRAAKASTPKTNTSSNNSNDDKPWLNVMDKSTKSMTPQWLNVVDGVNNGKINSIADLRKYYKVSKEVEAKFNELLNFQPA